MRSDQGPAVILVVENEPMLLTLTMLLLSQLGYTTFQASSPANTIALLECHPEIEIVFTDVEMADTMDGLALAIYAADRWPPLRFIIVSGGIRPSIEQMPMGAIFLPKPFRMDDVDRHIRSFGYETGRSHTTR